MNRHLAGAIATLLACYGCSGGAPVILEVVQGDAGDPAAASDAGAPLGSGSGSVASSGTPGSGSGTSSPGAGTDSGSVADAGGDPPPTADAAPPPVDAAPPGMDAAAIQPPPYVTLPSTWACGVNGSCVECMDNAAHNACTVVGQCCQLATAGGGCAADPADDVACPGTTRAYRCNAAPTGECSGYHPGDAGVGTDVYCYYPATWCVTGQGG